MSSVPIEKHQLAGVDNRQRGFARTVDLHCRDSDYHATLLYETHRLQGEPAETGAAALEALVRVLHREGYRQIQTRLSFRGEEYLGSQEVWVDYADPHLPSPLARLWTWLREWIHPART